MKKTAIAVSALAVLLAVTACNNIELTGPDLGAYRSQFDTERTALPSGGNSDVFYNIGLKSTAGGSADNTISAADELFITFPTSRSLDLDIIKPVKLEDFSSKMKEAIKFYGYSAAGNDTGTNALASTRGAEIAYTVEKWEYPMATIKLTLSTSLSDRLEVVVDPRKYTHHNGVVIDYNFDGRIDDNDLYTAQVTYSSGQAGTWVRNNPRVTDFFAANWTGSDATASAAAYYRIQVGARYRGDAVDFKGKFNEIWRLEKFDLKGAKAWADSGIKGEYTASDGYFTFTITGAAAGEQYRVVIRNVQAARDFLTAGLYFGYKQRMRSNLSGLMNNGTVASSGVTSTYSATPPVMVNNSPFSFVSVYKDVDNKNAVVTLSFAPADTAVVGGKGLPAPADAIKNGYIKLGYNRSGDLSSSETNGSAWNNVIFIPIVKVETFRVGGSGSDPDNRWQLTLQPGYEVNGLIKYLFISPQYSTLGDTGTGNVRTFGAWGNVDYVSSEGLTQYQAYAVSSLNNF